MYPISIFVTPTASQHPYHLPSSIQPKVTRKRKRTGHENSSNVEPRLEDAEGSGPDRILSTEYTAVVTPTERSQRRLAGLNLDQEPPPYPFPHAQVPDSDDRYREDAQNPQAKMSLHSQHMAAMMTVLHRSMMTGDYHRAERAMGLLLRNEVGGLPIDIRKAGLWGMGAEVLLRHKSGQEGSNSSAGSEQPAITREGFERAKLFYERLIVQYPPHKTWPDAVNSRDFCIALFGLWIYVTDQESFRMQRELSNDGSSMDGSNLGLLDAKKWELLQARQIADAMDIRMRDALFKDERELVRLRAMVALWTADLIDQCERLEEEDDSMRRLQEHDEDVLSDHIERITIDTRPIAMSNSDANGAAECRALAKSLLKKLQDTTGADAADHVP